MIVERTAEGIALMSVADETTFMKVEEGFATGALTLLRNAWIDALSRDDLQSNHPIAANADAALNAKTVSYAKASIVQALGKAADLTLDALVVQKGLDETSAWDARTFARATFVIWNEEANQPFTHTSDPYVSNPLRIPRFDNLAQKKARDKEGYAALVKLLIQVNSATNSAEAYCNLVEILVGLRRTLVGKSVEYPLPKRASLNDVLDATNKYLDERSGGARLQAIVAALFGSLSYAGLKIADVATAHVNAADVGKSRGGDIEFQGLSGKFGVEIKDKPLSRDEFIASIEKARVAELSDLMFVIRSNLIFTSDVKDDYIADSVRRQFSSGLNIYLERFSDFLKITLSLIGETGRQVYLQKVGEALETQSAQIGHKWAWADIVKVI